MIPGRYDTTQTRGRVLARRPWTAIVGIYVITLGSAILLLALWTRALGNIVFGSVVLLLGGVVFRWGVGWRRRRA